MDDLQAAEIEFSGFVDSYHSTSIKGDNAFNSSRTRFRGEMFTFLGDASLFASVNAVENHIFEESEMALHEAYLEYLGQHWEVRLGKQLIVWGKADGLRITDVICPGDYSEFITQDFDDIRMPTEMIRFKLRPEFADIELIWIPFFQSGIAPDRESPWYTSPKLPEKTQMKKAIEPEKNLQNSEIGGKISCYLSGFDFAFSAFHFWEDSPFLHQTIVNDSTFITPEYKRMVFVGLELCKPINKFVLRSEFAFYKNKFFQSPSNLQKNLLKGMIGLDWYPNSDWNLSWQVANDMILDYEDEIADDENASLTTLNVSRKLLRETLTISNMVYYGFNDSDIYEKFSIDYAMNDNLHFLCGADIFAGDEGTYAAYEERSQLWIKGKYSF